MIRVQIVPQEIVSVHVSGTTIVSSPEYVGPYDIIPMFSEQILQTEKRVMTKNVTIEKIPQYEVSNDYGGVTLIMGEEYFNHGRY